MRVDCTQRWEERKKSLMHCNASPQTTRRVTPRALIDCKSLSLSHDVHKKRLLFEYGESNPELPRASMKGGNVSRYTILEDSRMVVTAY
jgi:hypothetical protein